MYPQLQDSHVLLFCFAGAIRRISADEGQDKGGHHHPRAVRGHRRRRGRRGADVDQAKDQGTNE